MSHISAFNRDKQQQQQQQTVSSSSSSSSFTSSPPHPSTSRFLSLPHYLILSFQRSPNLSSSSGSTGPIELPFDLELGPLCSRHHAQLSLPPIEHTFYKLHGFVTQSKNHFLTYTRIRGGLDWWKCDDAVVNECDLGHRVASQGVVLCLYRIQEPGHR